MSDRSNFWRAVVHGSWALALSWTIALIILFLMFMGCLGMCGGFLGAFFSLFGM